MADGDFIRHLVVPVTSPIPPGPRICVPVRAIADAIVDRDGVAIARCPIPELAARIAYIINDHAGDQ